MTKHDEFIGTLAEIMAATPEHADGWPVLDDLGLDCDDLDDTIRAKRVRVTWPEHVITPRFNGDATYSFCD